MTETEKMKPGFIYILTNKNNTTLYVGVTANIIQRIQQHKDKINKTAFTSRYNLNKLVYYEAHQMIGDAIAREKQLKAGSRAKKITLIESINLRWLDLYPQVIEEFREIASSLRPRNDRLFRLAPRNDL